MEPTEPTVKLVGVGTTREGYSLLVFAEKTGVRRRIWWSCGGCWSRSADIEQKVFQDDLLSDPYDETLQDFLDDADMHLDWCSVHRADSKTTAA